VNVADTVERCRSQEAGSDARLVKPVDPARLVAVIAATAAR
jgi:DNA-binding response OmpR family regulator